MNYESGDSLFVAIAYHQNDEPCGSDQVVVGVFTDDHLCRTGVEAYCKEFGENSENALGPISVVTIHQSMLNMHGIGPCINTHYSNGRWLP